MLGKNYYMFQRQGSNLRDCQNMYELVPNVKWVLWYVLLYFD